MESEKRTSRAAPKFEPRLIIHGGAGNIQKKNIFPEDKYEQYRSSLLEIVTRTSEYMKGTASSPSKPSFTRRPSALEAATHAVVQLEDNPLFNASHGAVFTRDGINELEASVMVSRGRAKRGVGVMGLRRVRNPIMLARRMLEHGDDDLDPSSSSYGTTTTGDGYVRSEGLDVPSAQGHTQLWGEAAEQLARQYGLEMVSPEYFYTQHRWDEHIRALEREKKNSNTATDSRYASATWSADEYLPQGTVGAVAMDEDGVICVATSTGGLTNKLTGRIGDTPVPGAGFWAEEWEEEGDPTGQQQASPSADGGFWDKVTAAVTAPSDMLVVLSEPLRGLLADCLPTPFLYSPLAQRATSKLIITTRSVATSGTGNGDSFLRTGAGRTVGALARFKPESLRLALTHVAGRGGILQQSADDRWGRTGEGEGGMIGIESVVIREAEADTAAAAKLNGGGRQGSIVATRSEIVMDFNCNGMFRAWIDDEGKPVMSIWTNYAPDDLD
jgi:L-asparaginase